MATRLVHTNSKTPDITVIDYGVGNLLSVERALEYIGANSAIVSAPSQIKEANRIILPGVGAFGNCAEKLQKLGFWEQILEFSTFERPILGICVGMQLLLTKSYEFGKHKGLGLINGTVEKIPSHTDSSKKRIVPNVGWHSLNFDCVSTDSIYSGIPNPISTYFTHSFYASPKEHYITSKINYAGFEMCSSIRSGNVRGTQFHPEKSGDFGLKILSNFLRS